MSNENTQTELKGPGEAQTANAPAIPGPSNSNATNLAIAEVLMSGVSRLMRRSMRQEMLSKTHDKETAREMAASRSLLSGLAIYGASRLATRSVPGALLVAGGLALKTLYDRGGARQKREREKRRQLSDSNPEN